MVKRIKTTDLSSRDIKKNAKSMDKDISDLQEKLEKTIKAAEKAKIEREIKDVKKSQTAQYRLANMTKNRMFGKEKYSKVEKNAAKKSAANISRQESDRRALREEGIIESRAEASESARTAQKNFDATKRKAGAAYKSEKNAVLEKTGAWNAIKYGSRGSDRREENANEAGKKASQKVFEDSKSTLSQQIEQTKGELQELEKDPEGNMDAIDEKKKQLAAQQKEQSLLEQNNEELKEVKKAIKESGGGGWFESLLKFVAIIIALGPIIKKFLGEISKKIWESIKKAFSWMGNVASKIWEGIKNIKWGEIASKIWEGLKGLDKYFKELGSKIWEVIKGLLSKIPGIGRLFGSSDKEDNSQYLGSLGKIEAMLPEGALKNKFGWTTDAGKLENLSELAKKHGMSTQEFVDYLEKGGKINSGGSFLETSSKPIFQTIDVPQSQMVDSNIPQSVPVETVEQETAKQIADEQSQQQQATSEQISNAINNSKNNQTTNATVVNQNLTAPSIAADKLKRR